MESSPPIFLNGSSKGGFPSRNRVKTCRPNNRSLFFCTVTLAFIAASLYTISFVIREKNATLRYNSLVTDANLLELQKTMLSSANLARLHDITSGKLSRQHVEVVLSRHNEDIDWSNMYASVRTVYDKSDETNMLPNATPGKVVKLANLGRESYTYLWHIVHNYDTLAALTVFSQGSAPTHGYAGHRKGGGHLLTNSTFHDFVLSDTGHFIFTGAVWLPTMAHLLRSGYNKEGADRWQALQRCPTPMMSDGNGSEYRFDLDDKNHVHLLKHIAGRCTLEASTNCDGFSFWKTFVKLPLPRFNILFFSQGASFSVTAAQIRKRSLADYQQLLAEVSRSEDPSAGFFLEWMWYYIVTSDVAPCPVKGSEFDWAKVQPFYKSLPLPQRAEFTVERVAELVKKRKSRRCRYWTGCN